MNLSTARLKISFHYINKIKILSMGNFMKFYWKRAVCGIQVGTKAEHLAFRNWEKLREFC